VVTYTIAIPSYGRAGRVTSDAVFHDALVVVPESQAEEYAAHPLRNGCRIETIPDAEDGNISRKRNAILNRWGSEGDLVVVDDDYDYLGMVQGGEAIRLEWWQIEALLANGFQMAEDLDTCLWGLNVQVDPRFYREYSPFAFLSPILGPFMAFRPCTHRFDEDLWLKEDYDYWLQVVRKHHKTLRCNKYHYMVDHFNERGGLVGKRNMDEEVRQLTRLQAKWGGKVVTYDLSRSVNPRVRVPLRGI
jgi:hypothetical protein